MIPALARSAAVAATLLAAGAASWFGLRTLPAPPNPAGFQAEPTPPTPAPAPPVLLPAPLPPADPPNPRAADLGPLSDYLAQAALAWLALPPPGSPQNRAFAAREGEPPLDVAARAALVASAIAIVATLDPDEPSGWADDPPPHPRMALLVLSVALHESRLRAYVDDGRCNDRAWRASPEGARLVALGGPCDGGRAWTVWQMHLTDLGGVVLRPPTAAPPDWRPREGRPADPAAGEIEVPAADAIQDRRLAARAAWHELRRALRSVGGADLCGYTGEWDAFRETRRCPKGAIRAEWARRWAAEHPYRSATDRP